MEHILLFYPTYQSASSLDYQYKNTVFLNEVFRFSNKKGAKVKLKKWIFLDFKVVFLPLGQITFN
jgi:hypothetical protein